MGVHRVLLGFEWYMLGIKWVYDLEPWMGIKQ